MSHLTVGRQARQELADSQRQVLELKKTNYTLQQQLSMRVGHSFNFSLQQFYQNLVELCRKGCHCQE